ncbi:hypothetical protein B0H14DRAFT_3428225 [Mycena olivaceomarginata]|nr:hypothetical protein B0H14DRAFT_3428225 [Mycena olivaceomarginata]
MGFPALPFDNVNHGVPMNGRELRHRIWSTNVDHQVAVAGPVDISDVRLCETLVSGVVEQRRKRNNRGKLVDFRGGRRSTGGSGGRWGEWCDFHRREGAGKAGFRCLVTFVGAVAGCGAESRSGRIN